MGFSKKSGSHILGEPGPSFVHPEAPSLGSFSTSRRDLPMLKDCGNHLRITGYYLQPNSARSVCTTSLSCSSCWLACLPSCFPHLDVQISSMYIGSPPPHDLLRAVLHGVIHFKKRKQTCCLFFVLATTIKFPCVFFINVFFS